MHWITMASQLNLNVDLDFCRFAYYLPEKYLRTIEELKLKTSECESLKMRLENMNAYYESKMEELDAARTKIEWLMMTGRGRRNEGNYNNYHYQRDTSAPPMTVSNNRAVVSNDSVRRYPLPQQWNDQESRSGSPQYGNFGRIQGGSGRDETLFKRPARPQAFMQRDRSQPYQQSGFRGRSGSSSSLVNVRRQMDCFPIAVKIKTEPPESESPSKTTLIANQQRNNSRSPTGKMMPEQQSKSCESPSPEKPVIIEKIKEEQLDHFVNENINDDIFVEYF